MPWRQVWEPSKHDSNLPVLVELPEHVTEQTYSFNQLVGLREASGYINHRYVTYTYCHHCKGWIEGRAEAHGVNTLDTGHLSGRQGVEYYCKRCGEEIAFNGAVS